jgi:hypothetical protein
VALVAGDVVVEALGDGVAVCVTDGEMEVCVKVAVSGVTGTVAVLVAVDG